MTRYLNYQQLGDVLGIKVSTLYSLVCRKRIPHHRLSGRMVRFSTEEINDWLKDKQCPVDASEQQTSCDETRRSVQGGES